MTRNITAVLLIALLVAALAGILVARDTKKPEVKEESTWLTELKTVKGLGNPTWPYSYSKEKLGGVDVDHCLKPREVNEIKNGGTWKLNGKYARLQCIIGIIDNDNMGKSAIFEVIGDTTSLFKSEVMAPGDSPRPIVVDLKGVSLLTLRIIDASKPRTEWVSPSAVWGDAKLIKVTKVTPTETETPKTATPGKTSTPSGEKKPLKITILVNNTYLGIPCKLSEGRLYVPLFELDQPLEGTFKWDPEKRLILIKTTSGKPPAEKTPEKGAETPKKTPARPAAETEEKATEPSTPVPQK
jgi:hypothetical protein